MLRYRIWSFEKKGASRKDAELSCAKELIPLLKKAEPVKTSWGIGVVLKSLFEKFPSLAAEFETISNSNNNSIDGKVDSAKRPFSEISGTPVRINGTVDTIYTNASASKKQKVGHNIKHEQMVRVEISGGLEREIDTVLLDGGHKFIGVGPKNGEDIMIISPCPTADPKDFVKSASFESGIEWKPPDGRVNPWSAISGEMEVEAGDAVDSDALNDRVREIIEVNIFLKNIRSMNRPRGRPNPS